MALSWALLLLRPLFEKLLLGWYLCWAIPIHWRHSQRLHLWREFFSKLNYNILWVVCWIEIGFSYAPTHFWHFLKNCPTINIGSKWLKFSENTVDDLNYKLNFFQNLIAIFYGSFGGLNLASCTHRYIFGTFWKIALQSILIQNGWNFLKILLMTSIINQIFSKIQWEYFMGHLLYWNWLLVSANALFFSDN